MSTSTQNPIRVGSVVRLLEDGIPVGWFRVTRVTKSTVNLSTVFGKRIIHKGLAIDRVQEDEAAWYAAWSKSESYMCM